MRRFTRLFAAAALALSATLPASAGQIPYGVSAPPTASAGEITTGVAGDIQNGAPGQITTGAAGEIQNPSGAALLGAADTMPEAALALLRGILPLI